MGFSFPSLLLCALFITLVVCDPRYDNPTFQYNVSIPSTKQQWSLCFPVSFGLFSVGLSPCYGEYDWYIGDGAMPNQTYFTYYFLWEEWGPQFTAFYHTLQINNTEVCILVVGKQTYGDIYALFDLFYWTQNVSLLIPVAGNGGQVSATIAAGGGSGSLKWTQSKSPTDTYALYCYNGAVPTSPNYPLTACGARLFETPCNSTNNVGSVTKNSDGSFSAPIQNIHGDLSVTVIVTQPGGYSITYNTQQYNLGSFVGAPVAMLLVFAILSVLL